MRRKLKSISKTHLVEFQSLVSGPEFEQALADYLEVYRSSWKAAEPHPQFIATLARRLRSERGVRIALMKLDGNAIAAQIWLTRHGKATIFKLAHREDALELSPGTLLTFWMLERCCKEEGTSKFDFGRGNDGYKRGWLSRCRKRDGLIASNWRTLAGMTSMVTQIWPTRLSPLVRSTKQPH